MDNITKGDPIKADWANAITNALNAAAHGKMSMRGGGGQNVSISPYQRGSRPLAFDLVEITDDAESFLSGKISGGFLFHSFKDELVEPANPDEKKIRLKAEKIEIKELEGTFKVDEKVWVKVSYNPETWKAGYSTLESGTEIPAPESGTAYFVVGQFEERDNSIVYKHHGLTCIKWDVLKWEYKLKANPACALEIKKEGEENEITLNIESTSDDVSADSPLKVWLVQERGKGEDGSEAGPVRLGVRVKNELMNGHDPIEILGRNISLKFDSQERQTANGIKYGLRVENGQLAMNLNTDSMSTPESEIYTADGPIEIEGKKIKLNVDTATDFSNGVRCNLTTDGGVLGVRIDASGLSGGGEVLDFRAPLRKNGNYVVLDVDRSWSPPVSGISARLFDSNGSLAVEIDASHISAKIKLSESWTSLACDSNRAIRPWFNPNNELYIQRGEWSRETQSYEPLN